MVRVRFDPDDTTPLLSVSRLRVSVKYTFRVTDRVRVKGTVSISVSAWGRVVGLGQGSEWREEGFANRNRIILFVNLVSVKGQNSR